MTEPTTEAEQAERHASWPELFFDLVAVAGVSIVAHQLESEQSWQHMMVLGIAFIAFWITWAAVTTYGNLLADRTSMLMLFASMAVLGVMVASVPQIYGEHARAFAIAYVVGRLIMARPWKRGAVVVDLPIVQASIGIIPWIVSIWIEGDARYVWWGVGVALDLVGLLTRSGERVLEETQRHLDAILARRERQLERAAAHGAELRDRPGRDRAGRESREVPLTVTALRGDREHLAERMGLFVLIILGESIIQLTVAAEASEHWNRALFVVAMGAFAFIAALFVIAVVRGTAGLALLPNAALPARGLWLGHLVVSMALVVVGAAVGRLLEEPSEPIDAHTAAMLAIGIAVFGAVSAVAHLVSRTARTSRIAAAIAGPTLAAAALVGFGFASFTASGVAWILAAAVTVAGLLGTRAARE